MADSSGNKVSSNQSPGALGGLKHAITYITGPWTWENAKAWLMVIAFVLLVRWLWFEPFTIPSSSMAPTLHGDERFLKGDRVAVNKLSYGPRVPFSNIRLVDLGDPQRWDIVVFNTPEENATHNVLIKRVAGLPGERVHISNGRLYVNGEPVPFPDSMPDKMNYTNELEELERGRRRYVPGEHMAYGVRLEDEYSLVPEGHYFVLGDNSENSRDGRFFGWVPEENIVGRAFCIWWPWSHRRDFTGFSHTWWGKAILYGIPSLFVLYWLVTGFVAVSLRVRHGNLGDVPVKGDHVVVNRMMAGLRLPFTNVRIFGGRSPGEGELIAYATEEAGGAAQVLIGRVVGTSGQRVARNAGLCRIEGKEVGAMPDDWPLRGDRIPDGGVIVIPDRSEEHADPPEVDWVAEEDIIGNIILVWWPLHRARAIRVEPAPSKSAG